MTEITVAWAGVIVAATIVTQVVGNGEMTMDYNVIGDQCAIISAAFSLRKSQITIVGISICLPGSNISKLS